MDISKELMVIIAFGVGLYIERGYAPLRIASNSKTWAQRAQEMALFGTLSLISSYLLSRIFFQFIILEFELLRSFFEVFKEYFPYKNSGTIAFMSALIVISLNLINLQFRRPAVLISLYRKYGNAFERTLFDSFIHENPVTLTYKNGWVYIVFMHELPEVGKNELFLNVIVMMSGFKDEGAITTFTESKFSEFEDSLSNPEVTTSALSTSELMSVSPFSFSYNKSLKQDK